LIAPLCLALALTHAAPAEVTVLVVPVVVGDSDAARASALEAAVSAAARGRPGLRLMSSEEAFVVGVRLDQAPACGLDVGCLARLLGPARAELAMIVLANTLAEPPLLALRMLAPGAGRLVGSSAALLGAEGLAEAVEARAAALLDEAGFRRASWLRVEVSPPDAALSIDGVPEATRAGRFLVPPGEYLARARKEGFGLVEARVTVLPGAEAELRLSLTEEGSIVSSPWFWAAVVGAAVVSGAVAVYAGTRGDRCVCLGGPTQSCPPC
jgi:hypothetical protein